MKKKKWQNKKERSNEIAWERKAGKERDKTAKMERKDIEVRQSFDDLLKDKLKM